MNRRLLLAGVALAWTGCTPAEDIGGPALDTTTFFTAIRPGDLGRSVEAIQLISVRRGQDAVFFEIRISVARERLVLVALDSLGQRLMTIRWTEAGVVSEKALTLPPVVSPERLLLDLVAILWPQHQVEQALARTGASLAVQGSTRTITMRGREMLRAQLGWAQGAAWVGELSYLNVSRGYTVDVRSRETR
jgi:hypothetical protein